MALCANQINKHLDFFAAFSENKFSKITVNSDNMASPVSWSEAQKQYPAVLPLVTKPGSNMLLFIIAILFLPHLSNKEQFEVSKIKFSND